MRRNIAPIREPVFEAHVEITGKDGRKIQIPLVFDKTTRPWAEFFRNLSSQSADGHEAELAEDLFASISPTSARSTPSEQDLFGGVASTLARSSSSGEDPFGQLPQPQRDLSGFARHFLFMGA